MNSFIQKIFVTAQDISVFIIVSQNLAVFYGLLLEEKVAHSAG